MNEADKKLAEFFNLLSKDNLYLLSNDKEKEVCENIFKEKKYTDINYQDSNGNTYLHLMGENGNWDWFIKILNEGGDPTIKNKVGKNAFQVCEKNDGTHNFWRISSNRQLESFTKDWDIKTANFCDNYKQFLFDIYVWENSYTFNNIQEVNNFLENSNLNTASNRLALIGVSQKISSEDKIGWFEKYFINSTREQNTHFFIHLASQQGLYDANRQDILTYFLEKEFVQNQSFNKLVRYVMRDYSSQKISDNMYRHLIKAIFRNDFKIALLDVSENNETFMSLIEKNASLNAIWLEEKLSTDLYSEKASDNVLSKKKVKV